MLLAPKRARGGQPGVGTSFSRSTSSNAAQPAKSYGRSHGGGGAFGALGICSKIYISLTLPWDVAHEQLFAFCAIRVELIERNQFALNWAPRHIMHVATIWKFRDFLTLAKNRECFFRVDYAHCFRSV